MQASPSEHIGAAAVCQVNGAKLHCVVGEQHHLILEGMSSGMAIINEPGAR
jgi:hypothetical protein